LQCLISFKVFLAIIDKSTNCSETTKHIVLLGITPFEHGDH
jgi:hypothetical protein